MIKLNISKSFSDISDKRRKIIVVTTILLATLITSIPIMYNKFYIGNDDGLFHICRLIGTEKIFKDKVFLPLIVPEYANNFGYGTNIFYSPITATIPLIFRFLSFNFSACIKTSVLIISFLSGLSMYFFVKKVTDNDFASIIGAFLYLISPYRLTDAFIRVAFAELASFIFIPMVFNGLYSIVNKNEKSKLLWIGTVGLILSHTIITFYTAIFCIIYLIANYKCLKNKEVLKNLAISILLALLLTMFYLGPIIEHKIKGDYAVFDINSTVPFEKLENMKLDLKVLFLPKVYATYNFTIGYTLVFCLITTPFVIKKVTKKDYSEIYLLFFIFGCVTLYMASSLFPFEKMPAIFLMIQFTFRFLEFINFFFILCASINIGLIQDKLSYSYIFIVITIIIFSAIDLCYFATIRHNCEYNEEVLYNTIAIPEDTENTYHPQLAMYEYFPKKVYQTNYIQNREDIVILLSENNDFEIEDYQKVADKTVFIAKNAKEGNTVELPYIYYLGYRVKINGKEVKTFESKNGFVAFSFDKDYEKAEVKVRYLGTNFMITSYLISLGTAIYLVVDKYNRRKNTKETKK